MKKQEKWLLVANSSSARLFKLETLQKLTELQTFIHPESRLHERDLVSDKPGRSFESVGSHRHSIEPHTTQKEYEFQLFAKMLSEHLAKAHKEALFTQLYVIASPSFLGLLRQSMNPTLLACVVKEIGKDVVHASTKEIIQQITE